MKNFPSLCLPKKYFNLAEWSEGEQYMTIASTYILATVWEVIFGTEGNFEMNA